MYLKIKMDPMQEKSGLWCIAVKVANIDLKNYLFEAVTQNKF